MTVTSTAARAGSAARAAPAAASARPTKAVVTTERRMRRRVMGASLRRARRIGNPDDDARRRRFARRAADHGDLVDGDLARGRVDLVDLDALRGGQGAGGLGTRRESVPHGVRLWLANDEEDPGGDGDRAGREDGPGDSRLRAPATASLLDAAHAGPDRLAALHPDLRH